MDDHALLRGLPDWVEAGRGRAVRLISPSEPGVNSYTAIIALDLGRFAATWVRTSCAGALDAGSGIARRLGRYGIATGDPLITSAGALSHPTVGGSLALLRHVPGHPLTGANNHEQTLMAGTLARVHAVDSGTRAEPFMADLGARPPKVRSSTTSRSSLMYSGGRSNSAVFWNVYRDSGPAREAELIE